MAKVAPFGLFSSLVATAALSLGCARHAPDLPAAGEMREMATSSRFAQDNCPDILYELDVLESEKRDLESLIKSHRQHNQVAGYFGALLILPALAVEHDKEAKARLDEIQRRQDELRAVAGRKECLPATSLTW